jgi:hypothetical protein
MSSTVGRTVPAIDSAAYEREDLIGENQRAVHEFSVTPGTRTPRRAGAKKAGKG